MMDTEWFAQQIDALHKRIDAHENTAAENRSNDNFYYSARLKDLAKDVERLTVDVYLLKKRSVTGVIGPTVEFPFSTN
jgi:hypothetical protein